MNDRYAARIFIALIIGLIVSIAAFMSWKIMLAGSAKPAVSGGYVLHRLTLPRFEAFWKRGAGHFNENVAPETAA